MALYGDRSTDGCFNHNEQGFSLSPGCTILLCTFELSLTIRTSFPLAENQAAVIARVWSGRLALPSQAKMRTWESDTLVKKGDRKAFHVLKHPEDAEVLNALYAWAESASKVEGLENDGQGKLGLAWDREAIWLRSRFPDIKASFAKRGKARVDVKTLEDLGFVYSKRAEC